MKDNRTVSVEINDVTHYTRWIHKPSLQMHWHPNQRLTQLQWPDLRFQRKLLRLLNITGVINKILSFP